MHIAPAACFPARGRRMRRIAQGGRGSIRRIGPPRRSWGNTRAPAAARLIRSIDGRTAHSTRQVRRELTVHAFEISREVSRHAVRDFSFFAFKPLASSAAMRGGRLRKGALQGRLLPSRGGRPSCLASRRDCDDRASRQAPASIHPPGTRRASFSRASPARDRTGHRIAPIRRRTRRAYPRRRRCSPSGRWR